MKMRKQRKLVQANIAHNNAWNWAFERFIRAVVKACVPMSVALQQAYERSRNERQLHEA